MKISIQKLQRSYVTAIVIMALSLAFNVSAQDTNNEDALSDQAGLQYWNGIKHDAIETETGLQYKILIAGSGRKPGAKDRVTVHYRGLLLDGRLFDSSFSGDEPITFKLKRVIAGWTEGLQLMPVGSVYVFLIPPELAYGEKGGDTIPPDATLIFEIELISVK